MNNPTCPKCRHADHDGYPCLNMASDNDCPCTSPSGMYPALSSPPTDDVREALANVIADGEGHPSFPRPKNFPPLDGDYRAADAILAAFEVRPRGPVTDAEVERATKAPTEQDYFDDYVRAGIPVETARFFAREDAVRSDHADGSQK